MSDVRSGSSSDLNLARELSRRLVVERAPVAPAPARPAPRGYVAFPSRGAVPAAVRVPMPVVAAPPSEPEPRALPEPPVVSVEEGSACWDRLLDWCLDAFGAEAAFIMDSYGLVVATRGRMTADTVQGVGARLMVTLQHAEQMAVEAPDGTSRAVAVELAAGWLNGMRVTLGRGDEALVLTVGVASRAPFRRDERLAVEAAFASAMPKA
jgi:hypothetical protein